jgi:collagenase-like PrtC family protease
MFSIPHPGNFESLVDIIYEIKKYRKNANKKDKFEVYLGYADFIGTGRATLYKPAIEDIKRQVEYAHRHKVKFEIAINSACMGSLHLTSKGIDHIKRLFDILSNINVDSITLADPYLIDLANDCGLKVNVSCIALVDSPQKAEFYDSKGVYAITLDSSINRHFDIIENIKDSVSCKLKILVNEACLYKCPMRVQHFNFFSHANMQNIPVLDDYYYNRCINMRVRDKELVIKSPFIRPEDLKEYNKLVNIYKLSGRSHPIGWIKRVLNAYFYGNYDGNLMEILDCPRELESHYFIDNKLLDGAIEKWKTCDKFCNGCNYCKDLAEKIIAVKK